MRKALEYNVSEGFKTKNFHCKVLDSNRFEITRARLSKEISEFMTNPGASTELALIYFSGHGHENARGGTLVTKDAISYDEGIRIQEIVDLANISTIPNIVIILDCCFSGHAGNGVGYASNTVLLRNGLTILTSSSVGQVSLENAEHGIFTSLVLDALKGGGADVLGHVSIASIYNYVDRILGPFDQRPLFKSHISNSLIISRVESRVSRVILYRLPELFPSKHAKLWLDPSYEPDKSWVEIAVSRDEEPRLAQWLNSSPDNESDFEQLQALESVGLVHPDTRTHMYNAAIHSESCSLTDLGKFYWELADRKMI